MISHPVKVGLKILEKLEFFTARLYGADSKLKSVNEARRDLFANKTKSLKNLPPTADALWQHILRASYQAGYIWGKLTL